MASGDNNLPIGVTADGQGGVTGDMAPLTFDSSMSDPSGTGLSSSVANGQISYVFNLGQFNVDASMGADPSFAAPVFVPIGDAHFQANITWYAGVNKGWHQLFRFQADSDNAIEDVTAGHTEDIRYFCEPSAWLVGTDLSGVNSTDDSFNLLASNGPEGSTGTDGVPLGSTLSITNGEVTNNRNATGHEDTIAKDFLRHIANEVMGGYAAGAKKGIVDIFNNEEELLNDLDGNVNDQVYNEHLSILNATKGDGSVQETDTSSNIVQLYGNNSVTFGDGLGDGAVDINVSDTSDNIAAEILKQILTSTGPGVNGIDRLDNLLTPNAAIDDGTGTNTYGVTVGDAAYDYRRRRSKKDYVELLQAGDQITFVVRIAPKSLTPLGQNPIHDVKYRIVLTLADSSEVTGYHLIEPHGISNPTVNANSTF